VRTSGLPVVSVPLTVLQADSAPTIFAEAPPGAVTAPKAFAPRAPVLAGFGGALVMLMAAALWSRPTHTNAPTPADDTSNATAATQPAPESPKAAPLATRGLDLPPAATPPPRADALQVPAVEGDVAPPRGAAPNPAREETSQAAPPAARPVAGAQRTDTPEPRRTAVRRPAPSRATPAPECTPQLDALGLCAPGTTVTGR